jgi:cellulose synthase (UDP-forming)
VATETLTFPELFAPMLLVLGTLYVLGPALPITRGWARYTIFAVVWGVVGWYLHWRLFATMLPATGTWYEVGWLWLCFTIELIVFADQFILYLTFLRHTDHSAEADRHEARLRGLPPEQLPSVDVFIPTYNEPREVLEKTITGALCLDYPNVKVWVLDDGRRAWLKDFCEAKGVGYLNRPDNAHAKAGNINHALGRTSGEFVAVFDADFVPQRNFLMRAIGFFADPKIGIVQIPHAFYNADTVQANLAVRKSLPDEQRFFFDVIMPSRDGWDAAFCCGSNSVTRRAALNEIGGKLPTQSITEDILLTMTLLRRGYITRYLCERLAYGLAPETVDAFFVQRERWARGAIQTLYLPTGALGPGLTLMQRLLFLPTYWVSVGLRSMMVLVVPIVFLWTGLSPVYGVTVADVVYCFIPAVLALSGGVSVFAPRQHFALVSQVQSTFLAFRIIPTVFLTFLWPFGHPFKVTPKGGTSHKSSYAWGIFWTSAAMMALTLLGLVVNTAPEWRIVDSVDILLVVAFWSTINIVVLFLVCMLSLQAPMRRAEERLDIEEPAWVVNASGMISAGRTRNISLSGIGLDGDDDSVRSIRAGDRVRVYLVEVGFVAGTVVRQAHRFLGIRFSLPPSVERDLLIRKLFTAGLDTKQVLTSGWTATRGLLKSIWVTRTDMLVGPADAEPGTATATPAEKLPAQSLVIAPHPQGRRLAELGEERRSIAA